MRTLILKRLCVTLSSSFRSLNRGFTLVELLIVMAIMSLILSIVGPLTVKIVDKAQAQSELITLKNAIHKLSYKAFASATPYTLTLSSKTLKLESQRSNLSTHRFEYLSFAEQVITFNSRGYPSPETVNVFLLDRNETINLFKLIEGVDENQQ
jgi:prepilin-type N-terminal cleavage/methylation domain-containing protein